MAFRDKKNKEGSGGGSERAIVDDEGESEFFSDEDFDGLSGEDLDWDDFEDMEFATDEEEADAWFGPWWQERHNLMDSFQEQLTSYKPIQIRNFLKPERALQLHRSAFSFF